MISVIFVIVGLVLLAAGAEGLIRGTTALALRLGIPPLVVGLTIVALATGSPELAVSVKGALSGNSGISLGNVIGSNISNLALVLGLAALARPMQVRTRLIRREMPVMVGATALLWLLLRDGFLSRADGLLLLALAGTYLFVAYRGALAHRSRPPAAEFDRALEGAWSPRRSVVIASVGLVALIAGAEVLVNGAVEIAKGLGIGSAVIGLTVIAVGTSMPELAASVAAARKQNADVAFGNVIGSNTLNILAVLGITAAIRPFPVVGIRPIDFTVFLGTALLLLALMMRGWVLDRLEGAVLVILYAVYVYSLVG
ncbi:MAG: sodium:calcium antiporter [Actinobacteria bacterium HGW-Actinobacteria-10]|nr:MAG: sodium:calcium antiporter [Actinobacteria bacterium HGW-Actinobacteria-10]